ncbi:MAG: hypothetical protein ACKVIO_09080, partial [Phycisphaerales bacterium]
MVRWTAIIVFAFVTGCTTQLQVLTEQTNIIQVSDFSTEKVDEYALVDEQLGTEEIDARVEVAVVAVEEEVFVSDTNLAIMPETVGVPVTIEALVGQVNGRPVYANAVLAPISDQLQADAKKMSRSKFSEATRRLLYYEAEGMGTTIRGGRMYEL